MSIVLGANENRYYETLNRLFAITTGLVILLCLFCLPLIQIDERDAMLYVGLLGISAALTIIKYVWLKNRISYDHGYYITDVLNPIMTGLLIYISGRFGLYLYFIFFLQLMGSIALLRFRHVVVSATIISSISTYLFFIDDTFQLGETERYAAGLILLMVLFLMTAFTYVVMQEQIRVMLQVQHQKSLFIQDVSHELRTPLTVIKGITGLMWQNRQAMDLEKAISTKPDSRLLEHLNSATRDLETITERLSMQSREQIAAADHDKVASAPVKKSAKTKAEHLAEK